MRRDARRQWPRYRRRWRRGRRSRQGLERRALRDDQFADALGGKDEQGVHLVTAERVAFGRALHVHEAATVVHHDIHVGIAVRILGVVEIEHRGAVRDAPRDGRGGAEDAVALDGWWLC